ncbi:ubiquinol-cytochrome c reductase core subunit 1 [Clydaea vesicula]|uniref:Cytochrome b-c1 complex subunit 2, mitochondrial n=1 Tax=Clydaea vesicula TaxID=447962 RepID=A0AAD5U649_9FUNG|nr:ubiquinol-cytochrome c reductase core subunit 1 [Clydaea vesicula]KAJ3384634.1 ubiquinol-cytochrome c reductase core subunit 1 [Lobulomyces angularis]
MLRVVNKSFTRSYAVASNPILYTRKGEQPKASPHVVSSVSQSNSGVKIATQDDLGPVSTLAVVINAGSRNEDLNFPGVAHFLKNTLIRNIKGDNIVRTIREAELRGNSLYTSHTRESLIVATDFLRDDLLPYSVDAVPLLINNVLNNAFEPYEFLDTRNLVIEETEAALHVPSVLVANSLHRVAFRSGLGNSIFAPTETIHNLKRSHLAEFTNEHFTADNFAVVGSGVNQKELSQLVEDSLKNFTLKPKFLGQTKATKYYGGEERFNSGSSEAHFAIAFPSASFNSKEYAASLVLRALLDGSRRVSWGSLSGSSSLLSAAATAHTSVSAFNSAYTDAGLFGLYIKGTASDVKQVAQKAVDVLKSVANGTGFSDISVARAKNTVIVDSEVGVTRETKVHDMAVKVLSTGTFPKFADLLEDVSKVTSEDLISLAKTLVKNKPSVVSYGKSALLPYYEDLKL